MNQPMETVTLARHAMATRFEIVLHGENESALRAAGEEALDEIERLDGQLSFYNPHSQISRLNARASREPVQIEPRLFELLSRAKQLSLALDGAFDITIAPLMKAWGLAGGSGRIPTDEELEAAQAKVGMEHVHLDEARCEVRFDRAGVLLDLGAIGKGYALEEAAGLLRDVEIESAFIHGGTSTAYAIGTPPDAESWRIAVEDPKFSERAMLDPESVTGEERATSRLMTIELCDEGISVSAIWGKGFQSQDRAYGHVLNPRLGRPTEGAALAAVVSPSAADTDAMATGLLTLGREGLQILEKSPTDLRALVVERPENSDEFEFHTLGLPHPATH